MKLIFLIAFLYLFVEFMNRASVANQCETDFDKTSGLIDSIKQILSKPVNQDVVDSELMAGDKAVVKFGKEPIVEEPLVDDSTIDEPVVANPLITTSVQELIPDVPAEEELSPDKSQSETSPIEKPDKNLIIKSIVEDESIAEEITNSSAPVSPVDIKEWAKRNQPKKRK